MTQMFIKNQFKKKNDMTQMSQSNTLFYTPLYNNGVIKTLCIKLLQMIGYVRCFDSNKTMSFKVNDNELLKKYNKKWERVSNLMNIKSDSEPVYADDNNRYINTKIKIHGDKVNANFQDKKLLKENASQKGLSLIMLDSVIRLSKSYYPQTLLEQCKYEIKKNEMENLIDDDLDSSSSDNKSDNESNE